MQCPPDLRCDLGAELFTGELAVEASYVESRVLLAIQIGLALEIL